MSIDISLKSETVGELMSSGEPRRNLRLTAKLRNFHKFAKVDAESSKELEQCNEMLPSSHARRAFSIQVLEGSDNNSAASTERPSAVKSCLVRRWGTGCNICIHSIILGSYK